MMLYTDMAAVVLVNQDMKKQPKSFQNYYVLSSSFRPGLGIYGV